MSTMRHLASPIAKSFSEALRIDTEAGSRIFVAGQVGVAIPADNKPLSFEQEVRVTFDRIRESLRKLDAGMDKIVSIKVYLTDLAPYAEFSKVRAEVFPRDPPTSTAVRVAGLCLGHVLKSTRLPLSPRNESRCTPSPASKVIGPCLRPTG